MTSSLPPTTASLSASAKNTGFSSFLPGFLLATTLMILMLCSVMFYPVTPAFANEDYSYYDDDDTEDEAGDEYTSQIWDPLENINRPISKFNDAIMEPVLTFIDMYASIVPQYVRTGMRNTIRNLSEPYYAANNIIEGDLDGVFASFARFTINTLAGFGGIIDVADNSCLPYTPQGLSTTMGVYGVPPGPYLVLPFIGPSNFRHGTSMVAEFFFDDIYSAHGTILDLTGSHHKDAFSYSYQGLKVVDTLDSGKEAIRSGKELALDFYSFSKAAFYQIEGSRIKNAKYRNTDLNCNCEARKNRKDDF